MRLGQKLVHGVGINDYEELITLNGKQIPEYTVWAGMLKRCYSPKWLEQRPTYKGCTVADEWLYFSNFKQWLDDNGYKPNVHHIDKDILIPGNKIYSPSTCLLVTLAINNLLTDRGNARGSYPMGVTLFRGRFRAAA